MRTTLDLDDQLHKAVRRIAFEQRRSIGEVVSELALRGLTASQDTAAALHRPLNMFAGLIHMKDDFNDTPAEVDAALDESLR
jgi:hypothetical protein